MIKHETFPQSKSREDKPDRRRRSIKLYAAIGSGALALAAGLLSAQHITSLKNASPETMNDPQQKSLNLLAPDVLKSREKSYPLLEAVPRSQPLSLRLDFHNIGQRQPTRQTLDLTTTNGQPTGQSNNIGQQEVIINPPTLNKAYLWTGRDTELGVVKKNDQPPVANFDQLEIYGHASSAPGQSAAFQNLVHVKLGDTLSLTTKRGIFTLVATHTEMPGKKDSSHNNILSHPQNGRVVLVACKPNKLTGHSTNLMIVVYQLQQSRPIK